MSCARALTAIFVLALACAAERTSQAETPPGFWVRTKNPRAAADFALHAEARRAIDGGAFSVEDTITRPLRLDDVRIKLESAGAKDSPDVRLRFDLGEVYEHVSMHSAAIDVLSKALRIAPDHPAAEDAWLELAYAYAKSDRPQEERNAYAEYLKRAVSPLSRTTAELNMAEADMRLGNLKEAIVGYREAFEHAAQYSYTTAETATLAVWGLAVALDRYGDPTGSAKETERALGLDAGMRLIGHGPNVFFVPPYERYWYLGLGSLTEARLAKKPAERAAAFARAEAIWKAYVAEAKPDDRWLAQAKAHLVFAAREAKKTRGALPAVPESDDEAPL